MVGGFGGVGCFIVDGVEGRGGGVGCEFLTLASKVSTLVKFGIVEVSKFCCTNGGGGISVIIKPPKLSLR